MREKTVITLTQLGVTGRLIETSATPLLPLLSNTFQVVNWLIAMMATVLQIVQLVQLQLHHKIAQVLD